MAWKKNLVVIVLQSITNFFTMIYIFVNSSKPAEPRISTFNLTDRILSSTNENFLSNFMFFIYCQVFIYTGPTVRA